MSEQATATTRPDATAGKATVDGAALAGAPRSTGNPHGDAWGALTRTHSAIAGRLQEALAAADFPPLPWYEVLAAIGEAPERRMRMGDLAEALVITRGGLTKLVDRLVKAGLMERVFCETDRRVSYATLTLAGTDLLAEMHPVVVAELKIAFAANLSERQADELRGMLERVRSSACGQG
jgi:DNA-binding MarR family transcriptional regulator